MPPRCPSVTQARQEHDDLATGLAPDLLGDETGDITSPLRAFGRGEAERYSGQLPVAFDNTCQAQRDLCLTHRHGGFAWQVPQRLRHPAGPDQLGDLRATNRVQG